MAFSLGCERKPRSPEKPVKVESPVEKQTAPESHPPESASAEAEAKKSGSIDDEIAEALKHVDPVVLYEPAPPVEARTTAEPASPEPVSAGTGPTAREEGGALPPGPAGDEDVVQAAKRLAPERRGDWPTQGAASFRELTGRLIMGVGAVSGVKNQKLAERAASGRAWKTISRALVAAIRDVTQRYLADVAGLEERDRAMMVETAARNVFKRVLLVNPKIVDSYVDGETNTHYALAALRTDLVKAAARDEMERLARRLGRPVDEVKLQELLLDAFGPELPAPTPEDVF